MLKYILFPLFTKVVLNKPMKLWIYLLLTLLSSNLQSQSVELPYRQIPNYPSEYSSGNVVARMIDGLGYRYYWATEGLRMEDLNYKPSEEGRTVMETLQHIYGMSEILLESPKGQPSIRPKDFTQLTFEELRKGTLENLFGASTLLKGKTEEALDTYAITFQRGEKQSSFPYWNLLNGMLSDCIYHTGQIVLMRRSNGNPQNPKVNVFLGKTRS